ncbi:1,5-anhydro-D-fructose reductase [bacterium HR17]|uniref:1,5-anhydro-D-fructose reductase n=1 Tax=Candidatus Fervidibacter japonicus TaxID=2035412 RepID=A0A2H5XD82_9BACT|nr:1,5-anhydro-D-fructose reductase [bacterium HR17]
MSERQPLRCVLVGLGNRGRHWLQVCQQMGDWVTLVACVEPIAERREQAKAQWGLRDEQLFASLEDALEAVPADFVLDVTPPMVRERIAETALAHGLPVLAEKAMGADWVTAKRIVAMVVQAQVPYMVAQNYRFGALPRTTHRLLAEGFLGAVNTVVVGFYRPWGRGAHYVEMPFALLVEMAVHHFDTLRFVLGREPLRVWAHTWNAPWGWHKGDVGHTVVFEFEGNIVVTHHALGCSVGKMTHWQGDWRIEGERGSLTWEDGRLIYTRSHPGDQVVQQELPLDEIEFADTKGVLTEFVTAVWEKREPECSARDNLRTLAMVFGAIESARRHQWVDLAELLDDRRDAKL